MAAAPVCRAEVDPQETKFRSPYQEHVYLFCWQDCEDTFESEPQNHARPAPLGLR